MLYFTKKITLAVTPSAMPCSAISQALGSKGAPCSQGKRHDYGPRPDPGPEEAFSFGQVLFSSPEKERLFRGLFSSAWKRFLSANDKSWENHREGSRSCHFESEVPPQRDAKQPQILSPHIWKSTPRFLPNFYNAHSKTLTGYKKNHSFKNWNIFSTICEKYAASTRNVPTWDYLSYF